MMPQIYSIHLIDGPLNTFYIFLCDYYIFQILLVV